MNKWYKLVTIRNTFKKYLIISFLLIVHLATAQSFEPFAIRYSRLPQAGVNQADNDQYELVEREPLQVIDVNLRSPFEIGDKGFRLGPFLNYTKAFQEVDNWAFTGDRPADASQFGIGLAALLPVSKRVSLVSILGADQGTNDGVPWTWDNNLYKVGLGFILNMDKTERPYQMGLTLVYTELLGFPILNLIYKREFSDKWSVNLALPNYGIIDYSLSENTKIRFEERFSVGRFALSENENNIGSYNISRVTLSAGILQHISGPVFFQGSVGLTIWNRSALFDNSNEQLDMLRYEIPQPAVNFGILVNINAKNE
ncbi:DUF6268 family outer membrane beta-barrel protein [Winogradskyella endarachnes]|uniref:DUF6268 domain-containing protein n=1 Tax=Winogradskyella endarachnes TaxID=2681965 RepID=A0A6L6U8H0_9FLAO|nr:DUF6268 family outer membrane beta-barrel protein [Winogradskyella endarachnes]MUU78641.1 hypothetical protein [Winogradskyella endarachnes]